MEKGGGRLSEKKAVSAKQNFTDDKNKGLAIPCAF
jgi:hypothetical protein